MRLALTRHLGLRELIGSRSKSQLPLNGGGQSPACRQPERWLGGRWWLMPSAWPCTQPQQPALYPVCELEEFYKDCEAFQPPEKAQVKPHGPLSASHPPSGARRGELLQTLRIPQPSLAHPHVPSMPLSRLLPPTCGPTPAQPLLETLSYCSMTSPLPPALTHTPAPSTRQARPEHLPYSPFPQLPVRQFKSSGGQNQ